jgi:glycosyltransferase involved in cell wall biosynthesis
MKPVISRYDKLKPKVLYLRGSYLNPFEINSFAKIKDNFDVVFAHPRYHRYDLSSIAGPRIEIPCLDYINGLIPQCIAGHTIPNPLKYFGYEEVLFGLERFSAGYDLIIVPEQSFYFTWQIANKKKKMGYKMITMQHEVNPFWYNNKKAIVDRASFVRQETDLFIARSERAKYALICEGVDSEKIHVIGHGIDSNRFQPGSRNIELCRTMGIAPDRFIILFMGRLVWTKGIFALADAAKLLLKEPEIKKLDPLFLVIGEGDERSDFEAKLKHLKIDRSFLLAGNQSYERIPDIHRLADIFVLPSISTRYILEQFGIVLIESMATRKPVISTHCGAIDEVVGDTGILVQPNDYLRLHQALKNLCMNKDLRHEYGERGFARVKENFDDGVVASKITSACKEALGR